MRKRAIRPAGPLPIMAAALALVFAPFVARGQDSIETSFATALIRDVLAAVNQGNWTGNYTVLRDYAAPDFAAANDPTRLAGLFTQIRAERLDLMQVLVTQPVILKAETGNDARDLRLTGYFPLVPQHVSFDLTFRREIRRYLLTGISVGAFEAIPPPRPAPEAAPEAAAPEAANPSGQGG